MGNYRLIVIASAFAALLVAARCDVRPSPNPPKPTPDAGTGDCESACANLARLGCDEAQPTPGGASCVQVCKDVIEGQYSLVCVAALQSCNLDSCEASQ